MRQRIREEVALISPLDAIEQRMQRETLAWIDSGAELCRRKKPATPPRHLVSYFVLVDSDQVLLVDHINAGLWLPTGGHVDPDEHPRDAAIREAREELGIECVFRDERPLFLTCSETVGATAGHTDVSLWYVLVGDRMATLSYDDSEFRSIRWFSGNEVPLNRSDPHMDRFLVKLAASAG
jgi:8-oxo-dGTP pyrophosphatase MutT (NUDIX family)